MRLGDEMSETWSKVELCHRESNVHLGYRQRSGVENCIIYDFDSILDMDNGQTEWSAPDDDNRDDLMTIA